MSVQTSYTQATPRGVAGGFFDLSNHAVNTRLNGETGDALKFGMGVVQGTTPGSDIKVPVAGSTAAKFEGITVNGYTTEMDREGKVSLPPMASIGVMQYGKIWARIISGITPAYGQAVYLYIDGPNAGLFSNAADVPTEGQTSKTIALGNARFIGAKGTGDVAPVELFYQANE